MIKSTTTKAGFFIKNVSKSAVMNGVFHETEYTVSRGRVIDTMWITFNQTIKSVRGTGLFMIRIDSKVRKHTATLRSLA